MSKNKMISCVAIGDKSGKTRLTLDVRSVKPFMLKQGQSTVQLNEYEAEHLIQTLTLFVTLARREMDE